MFAANQKNNNAKFHSKYIFAKSLNQCEIFRILRQKKRYRNIFTHIKKKSQTKTTAEMGIEVYR